LMSPQGPVPVQSMLKSKTLEAAMDEFPGAMKIAVEHMVNEAQKLQQQQQQQKQEESRIIIPGR
jgi:hypothetical protein